MDNLLKWANKYSMLEDDIRTATQQVLVTSRPTRNKSTGNSKPSSQLKQTGKGQDRQPQPSQAGLTPLTIPYDKLLAKIQDPFDFRWPKPIKTNPMKQDRSRKCAYHKNHGHTMKQCRSLHYLVERLIRSRHLEQYIHSDGKCRETTRNPNDQVPMDSAALRVVISYIHGGLLMKNTIPSGKDKDCSGQHPLGSRSVLFNTVCQEVRARWTTQSPFLQ